jgi:hypothetical protein
LTAKIGSIGQSTKQSEQFSCRKGQELWSQLEIEFTVSTDLLQRKSNPAQSNNVHLISCVATEAITKLYLP